MLVALDIQSLKRAYFYFDKPVPYKLSDDNIINIKPVMVEDSEIFILSADILKIDKNSSSSVDIIQMSYLDFLFDVIIAKDTSNLFVYKLCNIMKLCLGIDAFWIKKDKKGRRVLVDDSTGAEINSKQFDEIRRIILYQNILNYDDEYIDPEIKEMMNRVDRVKSANVETPNIERQMSIITAHCGLPKTEQLKMTMRAHQSLFRECAGEVDFITIRPIALNNGKGKELEHWIYNRKKDKFDGYMVSMSDYKKSFGGDSSIAQVEPNSEIMKYIKQ